MQADWVEKIVDDFERGTLSRRQLVAQLVGLGAALAASQGSAEAGQERGSTFEATGLDHVALNVTDLSRSRAFYENHLGLKQVYESRNDHFFLGVGDNFLLALFENEQAGLNHYCYTIRDYDPEDVIQKLKAAGHEPRREADRVYFKDPDGITVQLTGGRRD